MATNKQEALRADLESAVNRVMREHGVEFSAQDSGLFHKVVDDLEMPTGNRIYRVGVKATVEFNVAAPNEVVAKKRAARLAKAEGYEARGFEGRVIGISEDAAAYLEKTKPEDVQVYGEKGKDY